MFKWLRKSVSPIPPDYAPGPVVEHTLRDVPQLIYPAAVLLEPRKWVRYGNRTGVVTKVDSSGQVSIDLVDEKGLTTEHIRRPVGEVRLARYLEIPESRRGDEAVAAALGYV